MDFEALRATVGEAIQSALDNVEEVVDDLRDKADSLVDTVFDKVEEMQAQPAAPQEREEAKENHPSNWKLSEPYTRPTATESGGSDEVSLNSILKDIYKIVVVEDKVAGQHFDALGVDYVVEKYPVTLAISFKEIVDAEYTRQWNEKYQNRR